MTRMEIRSRVGSDGVLNLQVPVGKAEANQEVVVIVEPVAASGKPTWDREEWKGFVDRTAGRWEGEPLVRPEQGEFEERTAWG